MSVSTCRVCLIQGASLVSLGSGKDSHRSKLMICVPEIDVDIFKNPALCLECLCMLDVAYKLKIKCLENEKKLVENLTLQINMENALNSDTGEILSPSEFSSIFLADDARDDKKRRVSEITLSCDPNELADDFDVRVLQMSGGGASNKRRKLGEQNLLDVLSEAGECVLKQEDNSQELGQNDVTQENEDCNRISVSSNLSETGAVEIKEEPEFFYSECDDEHNSYEYDIDATKDDERNYRSALTNLQVEHSRFVIDAAVILKEHSYASMVAIVNQPEDGDVIEISDEVAACNELSDADLTNVHEEAHEVDDDKSDTEGYLTFKVDTDKKFVCTCCSKLFNNKVCLNKHEQLCRKSTAVFVPTKASNGTEKVEAVTAGIDGSVNKNVVQSRPTEDPDKVRCTVCGEVFDKKVIDAHIELHNVVQEIIIDSNLDEATFKNIDSADLDHSHHDIRFTENETGESGSRKTYTCCENTFANLYLLHLHTIKAHGYVCYICNLTFQNKQALGGHFRIHNEDKSHECKECRKRFAQRRNLLRHNHFVHYSAQPYKCDKCGQRFRRNKYLEEHLRSHTQKFICEECGRFFTEMKALRRHKRFHVPRVHKCDLCGTTFTVKSSLLRHKKDIHGVKIQGKRSHGLGGVLLKPSF